MNLSRWNLLLFAAIGVVIMLVLVGIPMPDPGRGGIDSATGEKRLTAWDRLAMARRHGDARQALVRLTELARLEPGEAVVERSLAVLKAEVGALPKPSRAELFRLRHAKGIRELTDALAEISGSAEVTRATESFFDPLGRDLSEDSPKAGPDAIARAFRRSSAEHRPARSYLRVAHRFHEAGRQRGYVRWLVRGLVANPESRELRDALVAFYLSIGHLPEALAAQRYVVPADAGDAEHWAKTAQIASWQSRTRIEAEALERLVACREDRDARRRLLQLYPLLGEPERAVPHAVALARDAGKLADQERAATLAFEGGKVVLGLDLMTSIAVRSTEEARWRQKTATLAAQDLRFGRAMSELEAALAALPEPLAGASSNAEPRAQIERQLEALYRRRDVPDKLADLLERRLDLTPSDATTRTELVSILASLGRKDRIARLLSRRAKAEIDSPQFFEHLGEFSRGGAQHLPEMALSAVHSDTMKPQILSEVLENLRPFLDRPEFRKVAVDLVSRFPKDPIAKTFRLELVDRIEDPAKRVAAARDLALSYRKDVDLLRAWADRASWVDDVESEIDARTRLIDLGVNEPANRLRVADLYESIQRLDLATEQVRALVAGDGPRSPAFARLVNLLFASDHSAEAVALLEKRAALEGATVEEKLTAADQLFAAGFPDRALTSYRAVVAEVPDHAQALLRCGQILSWANDPSTALRYLERCLTVSRETSADNEPLVEFYLADALWAVGRREDATAHFTSALAGLRAMEHPGAEVESLIARSLVRLGDFAAAQPIYRRLVAAEPRNVDLGLDYADALISQHDYKEARRVIDRLREWRPHHRRLLRVFAELLAETGKYDYADNRYELAIRKYGPEAGIAANRGRNLEARGEWRDAQDSYHEWLLLSHGSLAAKRAVQRIDGRLAHRAATELELSSAGDDRRFSFRFMASDLLDDERTRISGSVGYAQWRGRAAVVNNGASDLHASAALLDVALSQRVEDDDFVAVGLAAYPGVSGGVPVGAWAAAHVDRVGPYRSFELRLFANALLAEPAAGAALGGRSTGIDGTAFVDLGDAFWAAGAVGLRAVSVDPPASPSATDALLEGSVSVGVRVIEGDPAVAPRWRVQRVPQVEASPFLNAEPELTRDELLNVWLGYQTQRLIDDGELARLLPMVVRTDYLSVSASYDKHVYEAVGARIEASIGTELHRSTLGWGVEAGLTWRPSPLTELTLRLGGGRAIGRDNASDSSKRVLLQALFRW